MVMDASKIKKYVLGGSGFIFAVTLVVFAMAVAQRDSRTKDAITDPTQASYANQTAEGISHDPTAGSETWPPPIIVRSNDSELAAPPALPVPQVNNLENEVGVSESLPNVASLSNSSSANPLRSFSDSAEPPPLGEVADLPEITSADLNAASALPPLTSSAATDPQQFSPPEMTSQNGPNSFVSPPSTGELPSLDSTGNPSLPPLLGGTDNGLGTREPIPALPDAEGSNFGTNSLPPTANDARGALGDLAPAPSVSPFGSPAPSTLPPIAGSPVSQSPSIQSNTSPTNPMGDGFNGSPSQSVQPNPISSAPPNSLPPTANLGSPLPVPGNESPFGSSAAPTGPMSAPSTLPSTNGSSTNPLASNSPSSNAARSTSAPPPNVQSFNSNAPGNSPGNAGLQDSSPTRSSINAAMVSSAAGAAALLSSAAPGVRQLEGAQNPSLEIHKQAPSEVQVGVPATFKLIVRNVGTASAYDVAVHDAVPKGAKLVRTAPAAQVDEQGKILWKLGEMPAGSEQVLALDLTPETEGELGSVASVTFAAQASVRTVSTQPKLLVKQTVSSTILGGDIASIVIEVTNTGTGTAKDVELEEDVPANMRHASGVSTLGLTIGDLAPGESEKVVIELTGVSAGKSVNRVRAISSNNAAYESEVEIEVVQPKLAVNLEGPRLRYLERQATYRATISNTGTATAQDIELLLYLPRGLEYNSAANEGTYLREQHAVVWSLAELAAGATVNTEVTLLPVQEGEFVIRMQCDAIGVQAESLDKKVQVEGQSELFFTIEDDNDPIETDGLTTYIVKISNSGTRIDSNVQLVFEIPEGSVAEQVNAPVNHQPSQRAVVFDPIPRMQPKDTQTYRIAVRHSKEGTIVARAQLKSDNRPVPVIKEESTHVYRDN